ncbi:hypothetical protein GBF38_012060, partial [Nibea albiflora]
FCFKARHALAPSHIAEFLLSSDPERSLRTSGSALLAVRGSRKSQGQESNEDGTPLEQLDGTTLFLGHVEPWERGREEEEGNYRPPLKDFSDLNSLSQNRSAPPPARRSSLLRARGE